MATIMQGTYQNAFSAEKIVVIWLIFYWSLSLSIQLTTIHLWLRRHAITWAKDEQFPANELSGLNVAMPEVPGEISSTILHDITYFLKGWAKYWFDDQTRAPLNAKVPSISIQHQILNTLDVSPPTPPPPPPQKKKKIHVGAKMVILWKCRTVTVTQSTINSPLIKQSMGSDL